MASGAGAGIPWKIVNFLPGKIPVSFGRDLQEKPNIHKLFIRVSAAADILSTKRRKEGMG